MATTFNPQDYIEHEYFVYSKSGNFIVHIDDIDYTAPKCFIATERDANEYESNEAEGISLSFGTVIGLTEQNNFTRIK